VQEDLKKLFHPISSMGDTIRMPFLVPSGPVEPDGWLQRLGPIGPIYDEGGRPTSLVVAGASVASPVRVIRPKEMTVNAVKSKLSESDWNFWLAVGSIESAYHEGNLEEVRIQYARLLPVIYGHSKQGAELFDECCRVYLWDHHTNFR
jgi:hypothetical protein